MAVSILNLKENELDQLVGKEIAGAAINGENLYLVFTDSTAISFCSSQDDYMCVDNTAFFPEPIYEWRRKEREDFNAMLLKIRAFTQAEIDAVCEEYYSRYPEDRPR